MRVPTSVFALVSTIGLLNAAPITLSFVPPAQLGQTGTNVSVDVVISGTEAGVAPSIGTYDLDVGFNPAVLLPLGVSFGSFLGNELATEVLNDFSLLPAAVDFAAVSILPPDELNALQPDSFVLAIIDFQVIGPGMSALSFDQIIVDDAFGAKLSVTGNAGSVTGIPEPGAAVLAALALAALIRYRWR